MKHNSTGPEELLRISSAGLESKLEIAIIPFSTVSWSSLFHAIWFSSIHISLDIEPKIPALNFEYDLAASLEAYISKFVRIAIPSSSIFISTWQFHGPESPEITSSIVG